MNLPFPRKVFGPAAGRAHANGNGASPNGHAPQPGVALPGSGRAPDLEFVPRHSLAAALEALAMKGNRRILVTSHSRGAGRSSFVVAAGCAVAETGRGSVVLVDADSHQPSLHRHFDLSPGRGLAELLDEIYLLDLSREDPTQFGVGDWLEVLRAQRRTGRLNVREDGRTFTIGLARGHACGITSSQTTPAALLGELLMRRGRITAEQRGDALRIHDETARPLGEVLTTLGFIGEPDLVEALEVQCGHWLVELIALRRPECWFDELAEPYVFAAGGRRMRMPEAEGLQRFLSGRVLEYLRQPFLCGQTPSYLQDTHLRNLKVLTAGLRVCDLAAPDHLAPFELLLRRLARAFDFVLVDAPPVFPGGPTACMAPLVDGVLIVVGAGDADVPGLRGAVDELRLARANVMGAVLNHAPIPLEPRLVRNGEGPQRS